MNSSTIERIRDLARRLESEADRLTIDGDAHITRTDGFEPPPAARQRFDDGGYYHGMPISAEDLNAEMALSKIDMALIWQNPAGTLYGSDFDSNAQSLLAANEYIHESALRYRRRFIPAGWVDPKSCGVENTLTMVDTLVSEFGFVIVKMNPAQNAYPINSPDVMTVVDRIVELGAVPAFHVGADSPYTPADGLREVAERHPDHPVVAVHMGGGGASYTAAEGLYQDIQALGLERPNIRYVLSSIRDTYIEDAFVRYQLAGEPFCHNLFCGSDAPYGRQSWNFGGFRAMLQTLIDGERHPSARVRAHPGLFTPAVAQNYLGGNLACFMAASYKRLFARSKLESAACR